MASAEPPPTAPESAEGRDGAAGGARCAARMDGKATAAAVRAEVKAAIAAMATRSGGGGARRAVPGLAVVLVGDRPDSSLYVRMKHRACEEVGIASLHRALPADVTQEEAERAVEELNADPAVHGVLVQLPLPPHLDEGRLLDAVALEKDVDGLHSSNVGALHLRGREPTFVACTALGVMELLRRHKVRVSGSRAVVLGRSNIVGTPTAAALRAADATVTCCHSRSVDVAAICREADILVVAIGKPQHVRGDWVKEGAVVVDVGINELPDASAARGVRLVGDVHFDEVSERASLITPVPGGVGPMTIAMLMQNTLVAAQRRFAALEADSD